VHDQRDTDAVLARTPAAAAAAGEPGAGGGTGGYVSGVDVPGTEPKRQNEISWSMDGVSAFTVPTQAPGGTHGQRRRRAPEAAGSGPQAEGSANDEDEDEEEDNEEEGVRDVVHWKALDTTNTATSAATAAAAAADMHLPHQNQHQQRESPHLRVAVRDFSFQARYQCLHHSFYASSLYYSLFCIDVMPLVWPPI